MDAAADLEQIKRVAIAHGLDEDHAEVLSEIVLAKLNEAAQRRARGEEVTMMQIVESIQQYTAEENIRLQELRRHQLQQQGVNLDDIMDEDDPDELLGDASEEDDECARIKVDESNGGRRFKFQLLKDGLENYLGDYAEDTTMTEPGDIPTVGLRESGMNLITAMSQRVELAVELAKHLGPEDLLNVYSISRPFYEIINGHLLSSVRQIISYKAPEAGRIFNFRLYRKHLVPDPAKRTWAEQFGPQHKRAQDAELREVRLVPGIKYLQLVLLRDRCCRDIVAMMARHGFRTPPGMYRTLLRIWLTMDISTSRQRVAFMRNEEEWTDTDLYNAQLLFMKLGMFFNDPIYGMLTHDMTSLCFGQRSLYSLWQVFMRRKFTTPRETLDAKVRYDFSLPPDFNMSMLRNQRVFGVPLSQVGRGHLEGWGGGRDHLMRPDELVPHEAVRRGLELDDHLVHMLSWGYFDWITGENLVPTEDEMYISDEERVLANIDTSGMWQRKHAMKKRWRKLKPEEREAINRDDDDERLRALAWAFDHPVDTPLEALGRVPRLDDEINRGCILPKERPAPDGSCSNRLKPPSLTDPPSVWAAFGHSALLGHPPELSGDELLRAEAWNNYRREGEAEADWDWAAWLEQHEQDRAAAGLPGAGETADLDATDHESSSSDDEDEDDDAGDEEDEEDEEDDEDRSDEEEEEDDENEYDDGYGYEDDDDDDDDFELESLATSEDNQQSGGSASRESSLGQASGQNGETDNHYNFTGQDDEGDVTMNDEELEKYIGDFFDHVMMDGVEQG